MDDNKKICQSSYKVKIKNKRTAELRIEFQKKDAGIQLYQYKCSHCGCYHLTKNDPSKYNAPKMKKTGLPINMSDKIHERLNFLTNKNRMR